MAKLAWKQGFFRCLMSTYPAKPYFLTRSKNRKDRYTAFYENRSIGGMAETHSTLPGDERRGTVRTGCRFRRSDRAGATDPPRRDEIAPPGAPASSRRKCRYFRAPAMGDRKSTRL